MVPWTPQSGPQTESYLVLFGRFVGIRERDQWTHTETDHAAQCVAIARILCNSPFPDFTSDFFRAK